MSVSSKPAERGQLTSGNFLGYFFRVCRGRMHVSPQRFLLTDIDNSSSIGGDKQHQRKMVVPLYNMGIEPCELTNYCHQDHLRRRVDE